MATPTARYTGGKQPQLVNFPEKFKEKLCELCPDPFKEEDFAETDPFKKEAFAKKREAFVKKREAFVEELLDQARPYLTVPDIIEDMCSPEELLKEARNFKKSLDFLADNLKHMSPGIQCILSGVPRFDQLTNQIRELSSHLERACKIIKKQGHKQSPATIIKQNARELGIQVLLILQKYEIKITTSGEYFKGQKELHGQSCAIDILQAIYSAVGFPDSPSHVKATIAKLKNEYSAQLKDPDPEELKTTYPSFFR